MKNDINILTKDILKASGILSDTELNYNEQDIPMGFSNDDINANVIDVDEIDNEATRQARLITERLSNFCFSEEYIKKHPYIPVKISSEMNNIRMLLKMLAADEKAQDLLIKMCGLNIGNSRMFSSLTTIQSTMLNIQKQLNEIVEKLEHIFLNMQKESGISFDDADKETSNDSNNAVAGVIRGSREFVLQCQIMAGLGNDNKRSVLEVAKELSNKETKNNSE